MQPVLFLFFVYTNILFIINMMRQYYAKVDSFNTILSLESLNMPIYLKPSGF